MDTGTDGNGQMLSKVGMVANGASVGVGVDRHDGEFGGYWLVVVVEVSRGKCGGCGGAGVAAITRGIG
jgi:hypothetical protein